MPKQRKKIIRLNGMFFKVFYFIFYAGAITPVLTFEYFGFVCDYKFLIGSFILMPFRFSMCMSVLEKQPFPF